MILAHLPRSAANRVACSVGGVSEMIRRGRGVVDGLTRDVLLARAGYRCEYCGDRLTAYELDHVLPRAKRGPDDPTNRSVTCPKCNRNKGASTEGYDFVTGQQVRLFDPRQDRWPEHFKKIEGEIVGTTPMGRATANLLFRRSVSSVSRDLNWAWARPVTSESLYLWLNEQRARRLENNFGPLSRALSRMSHSYEFMRATTTDKRNARAAAELLRLELLFTRARPNDVAAGVSCDIQAWRRESDPHFQQARLEAMSVLFGQMATLEWQRGRRTTSGRHEKMSADLMQAAVDLAPVDRRMMCRLISVRARIDSSAPVSRLFWSEVFAGDADPRMIVYGADVEIAAGRTSRHDRIATRLHDALERIGYGQGRDWARGASLRRRWWGLLLMRGEPVNEDLLRSDIQVWRKTNLHNELRELQRTFAILGDPQMRRSFQAASLRVTSLTARAPRHPALSPPRLRRATHPS
jgi:hypothetical protein